MNQHRKSTVDDTRRPMPRARLMADMQRQSAMLSFSCQLMMNYMKPYLSIYYTHILVWCVAAQSSKTPVRISNRGMSACNNIWRVITLIPRQNGHHFSDDILN